jgi:hypothetical protein
MSPRQNITINEDTSWERMWASETSSLLRIIKPWVTLIVLFGVAAIYHLAFGDDPHRVPWAASGMTLAGAGLSAYAWQASKLVPAGRAHTAATVALICLYLTISVITGPVNEATGLAFGIFGPALAGSWNLRSNARAKMATAGHGGTPAGRLSEWFADAAKEAGMAGTTLQVKSIEPHRATATAIMPPGERTAGDLQNRVKHIESGGQIPPGSLSIAEDPDRADHAIVNLSDPRAIRRPIPHPGPSAPGQSIAMPLRTGLWQDGTPVLHPITGHHLHIMGASGSGKSEGACWGYAAEIMTRPDAVMIGADLRKSTQTFGPISEALHRLETTRDGVRDMLNTLHKLVAQRTEWLGDHGYTQWTPGCGLSYWVPWLEETPGIYDALTSKEQENWISDVLTLRSGGGTWVVSLQRDTFDQLPTIIRGQMAHLCFGLQDEADARYGLSKKQQDLGADPAELGIDYPGTAYLHYPGTAPERIAMRMRHYAWGDLSSKEAHIASAPVAMAEYAAQWPASAKPVDELTAVLIGGQPAAAPRPADGPARPVAVLTRPAPDDDQDDDPSDTEEDSEMDQNVLDEYLTVDDPSPEIEADMDDEIGPDDDEETWEFDLPDPVDPATARRMFEEFMRRMREAGKTELRAGDFKPLWRPGMERAWTHARLKEAVARGELEHDPAAHTYTFREAA